MALTDGKGDDKDDAPRNYMPQHDWSSIEPNGDVLIGTDKNVRVDVTILCDKLKVKPDKICVALIVQPVDNSGMKAQAKCPCPDQKGHRSPTDDIHAVSLRLRPEYQRFQKQITGKVNPDLHNKRRQDLNKRPRGK